MVRLLANVILWSALGFSAPVVAATWVVVPTDSKISFSGEHVGRKFKGSFETWDAAITFDAADLATAKAVVTVVLASAKTGDQTYDKTLPSSDWFDIGKSSKGVFETTAFRALSGDTYEADGSLTLRGLKLPVVFAFDFKADGDRAKLTGKTSLKRLDFGIGKGSDGDGSWVSLDIPVDVVVSLQKAP